MIADEYQIENTDWDELMFFNIQTDQQLSNEDIEQVFMNTDYYNYPLYLTAAGQLAFIYPGKRGDYNWDYFKYLMEQLDRSDWFLPNGSVLHLDIDN